MKKQRQVRILLLQLRKDPSALSSERSNFLSHSRLHEGQLISFDVYRQPSFDPEMIQEYNGFFVGGLSDDPSGDVRINAEFFPFIHSFNKLLDIAENKCVPGLLSCGGFMLATKHWGAKIVLDENRCEMGVYNLQMNDLAKKDILFKELQAEVKVVSGHLKSTESVPTNCILLASTDRCPVHVLRLKAAPIYAFQGHPEITTSDLKDRVTPYRDKYFKDETSFYEFLSHNEETGPVNSLISRFIQLIDENSFVF